MSLAKLKDQIARLKTPADEPPTPDERDEAIERLERALDEAQDNAAALRATVDELRFRNDTLEKSYSTQLADARERCEAAEAALAELQGRLDELGGGEDLLDVIAAARADLERITGERDRLRERIREPATGRRPAREESIDTGADLEAYSIDELLEDAIWAREQARLDQQRGRAPVGTAEELPPEDLVPPDLVFPRKAEE